MVKREKPEWVDYTKDEVEKIVIKLAKEGKSQAEIGMILRDQYGIPNVKIFGTTIKEILAKNNLLKEIPEDLFNLLRKVVRMYEHLDEHHGDKKSKHMLQLTESKIRKLAKYYIKKGELPEGWKYDPQKAKLIVKGA